MARVRHDNELVRLRELRQFAPQPLQIAKWIAVALDKQRGLYEHRPFRRVHHLGSEPRVKRIAERDHADDAWSRAGV